MGGRESNVSLESSVENYKNSRLIIQLKIRWLGILDGFGGTNQIKLIDNVWCQQPRENDTKA